MLVGATIAKARCSLSLVFVFVSFLSPWHHPRTHAWSVSPPLPSPALPFHCLLCFALSVPWNGKEDNLIDRSVLSALPVHAPAGEVSEVADCCATQVVRAVHHLCYLIPRTVANHWPPLAITVTRSSRTGDGAGAWWHRDGAATAPLNGATS